MKFYIDNFALRLLFCVLVTVAAANLGYLVRATFIVHEPFAFDAIQGLLIPAALGVFAAVMWKPTEK